MLAILFKNNKTGEISVKKLISIGQKHSEVVKSFQRHYDALFGKDAYTFYIGDDTPHYKNGPYGGR